MNWFEVITQLGVAGFSLYILWDLIKRHNKRVDIRDNQFRDYANEHNHKMTELVVTCKDEIKESTTERREAIKVIQSLFNKLNNK